MTIINSMSPDHLKIAVLIVILYLLIGLIIGVQLWQILRDCRKIKKKILRNKELQNGNTPTTGTVDGTDTIKNTVILGNQDHCCNVDGTCCSRGGNS